MKPEQKVKEWWERLSSGDRAELRRAKTLSEALLTKPANELRWRLADEWRWLEGVALIAAVLGHVRNDSEKPVAEALANNMSQLRFRRLMAITDRSQLVRPMVRAVALLDRTANVADLSRSLYWWNDRTRRDWAFAYYTNNKD